jgi:dihydrofolate synthase/folylpolyglutamate synthase
MLDVHSYLNQLPMFGVVGRSAANYDLGAIRTICSRLGQPQDRFKSIHIAGTNGKGSVSSLLASIHQAAGYRTGLYTSPHLVRVNERCRIDGDPIQDDEMADFFDVVRPWLDETSLTYFEFTTAMAFWWFAKRNVDIAVIETGLGGRLDATNVLTPTCSVITSIGMDHADVLGSTLTDIAREKAGILKPGCRSVIGPVPADVQSVFKHADPKAVFIVEPITDIPTDLESAFSGWNLALAKAAITLPVSEEAFRQGAIQVCLRTGFRARFERLRADRDWYFDGAHNLDALTALKGFVAHRFPGREPTYIMALMRDKLTPDVAVLLNTLPNLHWMELDLPRAARMEDLRLAGVDAVRFDDPSTLSELKLAILAGSFYFYQTATRWVDSIP